MLSRRAMLRGALTAAGAFVALPSAGVSAAASSVVTPANVSFLAEGRINLAYLARPSASGAYPGIVMIHDWWGVSDEIRAMADQLAQAGYVVLVPNLQTGQSLDGVESVQTWAARQSGGSAESTYRSAAGFLRQQPDVAGTQVGVMAFHFGGPLALQLAHGDANVGAAVVYQGGVSSDGALQGLTLGDMRTASAAALGDPRALFLNADSQSWERALRWFGRHLAN